MGREKTLVLAIVLLNMLFGYLFQLSNKVVCFTELSIISLSGSVFWLFLLRPIRKLFQPILKSSIFNLKNVFLLSGAGILAIVLNLFFVQMAVIAVMSSVFGCISPAFDTLNASLTNNIAGNLLCYTTLLGAIFHDNWKQVPSAPNISPSEKISVNHGKQKILLSFSEIIKIQSSNNCIIIFTANRKFVKYQSLKSILNELPSASFRRIHRNTIVNLNFIKSIQCNKNGDGLLKLTNGESLKFSRTFKKNLP